MKLFWLVALAAGVVGCTENEDDEGGAVADARCASGLRWAGGDSESPLMHPGADCIGCHASGEGPRFVVAGTVQATFDEPTDCYGVAGVTVAISDAAGETRSVLTNEAGNFFIEARAALVMPIQARITFDGRERLMTAAQLTGACATCHTSSGANGAPGRIVVP